MSLGQGQRNATQGIGVYTFIVFCYQANQTGVRVIGVLECNYLTPMHNKQDFEKTDEYRCVAFVSDVKIVVHNHSKITTWLIREKHQYIY